MTGVARPATVLLTLMMALSGHAAALAGIAAGVAADRPAPAQASAGTDRATQLRREIARLRGLTARYASAERSLLGEMDALERASLLAEREFDLAETREQDGARELLRLDNEEKQLAARLSQARFGLRRALLAAYERRAAPELWALLADGDPIDLPRNLRRIAKVGAAHQNAIGEFQQAKSELANTRAELQERTSEQARIRDEMAARRSAALGARQRKAEYLRGLASRRSEAALELRSAANELSTTFGALGLGPAPPPGTGFPARRGALPWPAEGTLAARFGVESHPRFHTLLERNGIEIRTPAKAPVRAVHAGQVAYADWFKGYGQLVIIAHGEGWYTLYAHLSSITAGSGSKVAEGAIVGRAGESPGSDQPGVYFELRQGDRALNPESWLGPRGRR